MDLQAVVQGNAELACNGCSSLLRRDRWPGSSDLDQDAEVFILSLALVSVFFPVDVAEIRGGIGPQIR